MTQTLKTPPYSLGLDEKATYVQIYTANAVIRGELVVKKLIRVSIWLKTSTAPDRILLYNAKVVPTTASANVRGSSFTELHVSTNAIQAFHLLPPTLDPIDYDPSEPDWRMQPVEILVANFLINGNLRLSSRTTIEKFMEVNRETFTPVYDAKINNLLIPALGTWQVPFVLVRQETSIFAVP